MRSKIRNQIQQNGIPNKIHDNFVWGDRLNVHYNIQNKVRVECLIKIIEQISKIKPTIDIVLSIFNADGSYKQK